MEDTSAAACARRRLLFRATHRGTREADLLVGGYIASRLATISDEEVTELERVLVLPDPWLVAVLTGQEKVAADHPLRDVLQRMQKAVTGTS